MPATMAGIFYRYPLRQSPPFGFSLRLCCALLSSSVCFLGRHSGATLKLWFRSRAPAGVASAHGFCSALMVWLFAHACLRLLSWSIGFLGRFALLSGFLAARL